MGHLEYLKELCDRLNELDGKQVAVGGVGNVTRRTYNGKRMDPEFVDQMAMELAQKLRREGLL